MSMNDSITSDNSIKIDLHITILGKGIVGKTSLINRILNIDIPKNHVPTIEDKYKLTKIINFEKLNLELLDTSGEKDYQNMFYSWVNKGDVFILVFAINDKESFDCLNDVKNKINEIKGENIPIILVGNKNDLKDERKVNDIDVKTLTKNWNDVEYIECSAKDNANCDVILSLMVLKWKNYKKNKNRNNEQNKNTKNNLNCNCFIY